MSAGHRTSVAYEPPKESKEIPVLAHPSDNDENDHLPPEFAMIEVNGNLIAPVEFPSGESCRQIFGADRRVELGKLYLQGSDQTPMMILGNHELKGKVEKLSKPFCLMEKKYKDGVTPKEIEAYQIIGIVRKKFLFKNYPKVIMR